MQLLNSDFYIQLVLRFVYIDIAHKDTQLVAHLITS